MLGRYCSDKGLDVNYECFNDENENLFIELSKYTNEAKTINSNELHNFPEVKCLVEDCSGYNSFVYGLQSPLSQVIILTNGITIFPINFFGPDWGVDTNGPYEGPNTLGRDIFIFGVSEEKLFWAGTDDPAGEGHWKKDRDDDTGIFYAGRLLEEGGMNY